MGTESACFLKRDNVAMDRPTFSTKARTLETLSGIITTATIAPLYYFSRTSWIENPDQCIKRVQELMKSGTNFIVRSSCEYEDTDQGSNAGAYLSVPDVRSCNLAQAIKDVFDSYHTNYINDEVLVQPMLENVVMSGVAFSHETQTCAPYRTINWSTGCGTSDVTSGNSNTNLWYHAAASGKVQNREMLPVIDLLEELSKFYDGAPIDCEFAFTEENRKKKLWLLQVRPLILRRNRESANKQNDRLNAIKMKLSSAIDRHPLLVGEKTVYGIMPDWNPAEILGIRPKPLAMSLYRELITDTIWAEQRHRYGYRDVRGLPLMHEFCGLPYIDVRLSFNSFIPADIERDLAEKLANYYLDRLVKNPSLHDKVEFDIVYSCYSFDLGDRLKLLLQEGFSKNEIGDLESSLRNITNNILQENVGLCKQDALEIRKLKFDRSSNLTQLACIENIPSLLDDTKRYGTLPFAGLARSGFIAVQILQSLVQRNVLSKQDYDSFMASCCTISTSFSQDKNLLSKDKFLKKYGHLRPGTYSITSPRYDEEPDLYFDWVENVTDRKVPKFQPTMKQMNEIEILIQDNGLNTNAVSLLQFIKEAIELREFSKFLFTRNLSDCLKHIEYLGEAYGIKREDMAFCEIGVIKDICRKTKDKKNTLMESIRDGKTNYEDTLRLVLPPLITSSSDIFSFKWPASSPNYITQGNVTAETVSYKQKDGLAGKIVCMPNADPGFDWVFLQPISGLITAWGGANSHMAIRAAELEIPAVIGAGEVLYEKWSKANMINLDCARQFVEVIR